MTTKKTVNVSRETLKQTEVRSVNLNKRKFYFMSDLERAYGNGIVSKLPTNTISMRIVDNGNSQMRRLVSASEFQTVIKKQCKTPRSTCCAA